MEVLPLRGPPSLLCLSPAIPVGRPLGVGTLMSNCPPLLVGKLRSSPQALGTVTVVTVTSSEATPWPVCCVLCRSDTPSRGLHHPVRWAPQCPQEMGTVSGL